MNHTATYSPEDNKLRLYPACRLDADEYQRVRKAGFIWAPKQELFVAPMWTPDREDLLLELAGEIGDEDTSLVDRAEERADRFEDYSSARAEDAERAKKAVDAIADNIPFGQPILVGHHSERHARRDAKKIENGMRHAIRMWDTSNYWKARAAGAIRHAKYLERPDVRARRIKGLESEIRVMRAKYTPDPKQPAILQEPWSYDKGTCASCQANEIDLVATLKADSQRICRKCSWDAAIPNDPIRVPHVWCSPGGRGGRWVPVADLPGLERYYSRWIAHCERRLEYERAMLAENGGIITDREQNIEVGGRVRIGNTWYTVIRVNRKGGKITSVRTNARYCSLSGIEEVAEYQAPDPAEAAAAKAATKQAPLTNFPSEGCHNLTQAEWNAKHKDYRMTRTAKATDTHGAYRYRIVVRGGNLIPVFLTDAKRVDPPAPAPVPEVSIPRPVESDAGYRQDGTNAHVGPPPTTEEFEKMRATLKAGVQVVSVPNLFPTPAAIATRMVQLAGIEPGMTVLEPSAGTGAIVDALDDVPGAKVTAVEFNHSLADRLRLRSNTKHEVICADFLDCQADPRMRLKFDRVLMNPPFENGADIKHILHARTFLAPSGRLVAICANGPRQAEKLQPLCDSWEELPAGTFNGTGVRSVLLTMSAFEHAYGCKCERCRGLFAAAGAQLPDGEYLFSDDELAKLAGA